MAAVVTNIVPNTISVDFEELAGFPQLTESTRGAPTLRTVYKVAWVDAPTLLLELQGTASGSAERERVLPHAHPFRPETLFQQGVLGPFDPNIAMVTNPDGDDRFAAYSHAKLTCSYAIPAFPPGDAGTPDATFVDESFNPRAEFLTIPAKDLYWDAGKAEALTDADAPQKLIKMGDWTFVDNWSATFPAFILPLMGKINAADVIAPRLGITFDDTTLLFQPPRATAVLNTEGVQGWKLEYNLAYKESGWNVFWHNGNFVRIFDDNSDPFDVYEEGDFTPIFP